MDQNYKFYNLGLIIRLNRESQNLSLSTLAEDANTNISQLSKIERGLEFPSIELCENIFNALSIDYATFEMKLIEYSNKFDSIFRDILYLEDDDVIIDKANSFFKQMEDNFLIPEYYVLKLLIDRVIVPNKELCNELITLLSKIEVDLSLKSRQLFYTLRGMYSVSHNNIDSAIMYMEMALNLYPNPDIKSFTEYQLASLYRRKNEMLKSLTILLSAKNHFMESGNYIRSLLTDLKIASTYAGSKEYDTAIKIYKKCIQSFKKIKVDYYSQKSAYINCCYIYILQDKYSEALEVLKSIPDALKQFMIDRTDKYYILYQMIVYTKLDMSDLLEDLIQESKISYNKFSYLDNYIMYLTCQNKNQRMRYLSRIKSLIYKNHDLEECLMYFKFMKEEAVSAKQIHELNLVYNDYVTNNI